MKRAVIFLNGNKPPRNLVFETIKTTDTIICADGGAKHVIAAGLTPHSIIGDLDSLSLQLQKRLRRLQIEWVTFPADKDFTDSELAVKYAIEKGFLEIVVLGLVGDRIDHMLANITFFTNVVKNTTDCLLQVVEEKQTMYYVRKKLVMTGQKGQVVSLLSLDGDARGVSTTGLRWKLQNEVLRFGESRGVSNEFIAKNATVSVEKGIILVIQNK